MNVLLNCRLEKFFICLILGSHKVISDITLYSYVGSFYLYSLCIVQIYLNLKSNLEPQTISSFYMQVQYFLLFSYRPLYLSIKIDSISITLRDITLEPLNYQIIKKLNRHLRFSSFDLLTRISTSTPCIIGLFISWSSVHSMNE